MKKKLLVLLITLASTMMPNIASAIHFEVENAIAIGAPHDICIEAPWWCSY